MQRFAKISDIKVYCKHYKFDQCKYSQHLVNMPACPHENLKILENRKLHLSSSLWLLA